RYLNAGSSVGASSEFPQIVILWRQNDVGGRRLLLAVADERRLIALHRAVEIVELRILAEARGVGFRRIRIGLGANDLRLLRALRADRARLLLARGAHAIVGGLQRRSVGKVRALDPDIDDLDAVLTGDSVQRRPDAVHDALPFRREKRGEGDLAQLIAHFRAENRAKLLFQLRLGSRTNVHQQ